MGGKILYRMYFQCVLDIILNSPNKEKVIYHG